MPYIEIVHKVDAIQFTNDNRSEIIKFMEDTDKVPLECVGGNSLKIPSCKWDLYDGDYLIKDKFKDLFVIHEKQFEEEYKKVE